jgi:hypothetical protein
LAATVAEGKVSGTNGPFITINASAIFGGVNRTAGLGVADRTTIPVSPGTPAVITVTISTPAWAAVDTVDFYVNNQPELTGFEGEAARYGVCANFSVTAGDRRWQEEEVQVIDGLEGASRRDITVTLTLPSVAEDSWVMAIAHGTDGESPPMFPIVPEDLDRASNQTLEDLTDDNLGEGGVPAYAFTNPVFLDVGANGWEAPGVMNEPCSE